MATIRFWYEKKGVASYISLLDLQRVMQRALKCSKLPVFYTQGFNPHIYITFAAPLSLGQQSVTESFEIKPLDENYDWANAPQILNKWLPEGICCYRAERTKMPAAAIAFAKHELFFEKNDIETAQKAFEEFEKVQSAIALKKGKKGVMKEIDLKEHIKIMDKCIEDDFLKVTVIVPSGVGLNINPILLVKYLEENYGVNSADTEIMRTALLTKDMGKFI